MVIGILIALQLNNWNENRKLLNKEHNYLLALREEVERNIEILKTEITQNKEHLDSAARLASIIDSNNRQIEEDSLALLLRATFANVSWVGLNEAIIREIMSTGSLNIIHNDILSTGEKIKI